MVVIDNFKADGHSLIMVRKFCGELIQFKYDSKTDTLIIDDKNKFNSGVLEDRFWNYLSDISNFREV